VADTYNFGSTVPALMKAHEDRYKKAQERIAELEAALAEQPAQGEAVYTMDQMRAFADDFHQSRIQDVSVAYWGAVDSDGTLQMTMSADDANGGLAARQEVNDWINETIAEDGVVTRLVALYTAPPAPEVKP